MADPKDIRIADLPPAKYFQHYRRLMGFTNQEEAKRFLGAKDIVAPIDYQYIDDMLARIDDMIARLDAATRAAPKPPSLPRFLKASVAAPYKQISKHGLLPKLNNQGRRPEEVLYSWLRGYATAEFYLPALSKLFAPCELSRTGNDDFSSPTTFSRTPAADYLVSRRPRSFRIEVQSGFQNISDVKQHKVHEAQRLMREDRIPTVCVHIDVFNGQCAFLRLDLIADNDVNWVTRTQMEGQTVFAIDQNFFRWRLADSLPDLQDLELQL